MLYLANWGSKQLAFRFPNGAINEATLQTHSTALRRSSYARPVTI
jgi:hypothetical protein